MDDISMVVLLLALIVLFFLARGLVGLKLFQRCVFLSKKNGQRPNLIVISKSEDVTNSKKYIFDNAIKTYQLPLKFLVILPKPSVNTVFTMYIGKPIEDKTQPYNKLCPLCLDELNTMTTNCFTVNCGHSYHQVCAVNLFLKETKTCPLCKQGIEKRVKKVFGKETKIDTLAKFYGSTISTTLNSEADLV
eukprot:TCONS_00057307-protein